MFAILREHLGAKVNLRRGRPGLRLWQIFVLATLQKALDCDFDRLVEWANCHTALRQMLGHAGFGDKHPYRLQTVIDHVRLLTEAALQATNAVVVARGHQLLKHIRIRFAAGPIQRWQRPLCTGLRMSACCGMRCAA